MLTDDLQNIYFGYNKLSKDDLIAQIEQEYQMKDIEKKYNIKQGGGTDNRWYCMIDGKRSKRFTDKKDLLKYLISLEEKEENKNQSIHDIEKGWKEYRRQSKSAGTFRIDMRNYNNYISGSPIVNQPIHKLTIDDAVDWFKYCKSKKPDMKEKYYSNVFGTLNSIFEYAKGKKIIERNPFENFKPHRDQFAPKKIHKDEHDIFLPDEKTKIKELLWKQNDNKALAILLLFNLGLREGELMALQWNAIQKNKIEIKAEYIEETNSNGDFCGFKFVDHCKSKSGQRELLLNSESLKIINELKKYNLKHGIPMGDNDFIFLRKKENQLLPFTPRTIYSTLEKFCKKAEMNQIKSSHDIRRTVFTDLFYAGMPLKNIQKFAGHATMAQTEAYIKFRRNEDTVNYLEAII